MHNFLSLTQAANSLGRFIVTVYSLEAIRTLTGVTVVLFLTGASVRTRGTQTRTFCSREKKNVEKSSTDLEEKWI